MQVTAERFEVYLATEGFRIQNIYLAMRSYSSLPEGRRKEDETSGRKVLVTTGKKRGTHRGAQGQGQMNIKGNFLT